MSAELKRFRGKVRRDRQKVSVPFLGCNAAFGGNGLRGRFAGGGVNLLTRIGQKGVTCLASCMDCIGMLAGQGRRARVPSDSRTESGSGGAN